MRRRLSASHVRWFSAANVRDAGTKHNSRVPTAAHVKRHAVDVLLRCEPADGRAVAALCSRQQNIRTRGRRSPSGVKEEKRVVRSVRPDVTIAADMSRAGQSISWSFLSVRASHWDRQDARRPAVRRSVQRLVVVDR